MYPPGLPAREHLGFYAREFATVEINTTYYRVPDARLAHGWAARTPEGFTFAIKAHQGLTHEREQPDFTGFVAGIRPLAQAGKLACVLAQFPYSFHPTSANRDYLKRLRDGLADLPAVIEFRHAGWMEEATFELLRSHVVFRGQKCAEEVASGFQGIFPRFAAKSGIDFLETSRPEWRR